MQQARLGLGLESWAHQPRLGLSLKSRTYKTWSGLESRVH